MTTISLTNENVRDERLVIIEPWGEEVKIPVGKSLRIDFEGPAAPVEIRLLNNNIAIYGWPGCLGYSYTLR